MNLPTVIHRVLPSILHTITLTAYAGYDDGRIQIRCAMFFSLVHPHSRL